MYYFFAFRSRTNAINFYETLVNSGICAELINTPSAAQLGCGLSVRIEESDIGAASSILSRGFYCTYQGLFSMSGDGLRSDVRRIK